MQRRFKCNANGGAFGRTLIFLTMCLATSVASAQVVELPDISLADESTIAEQPIPKLGTVQEFVGPVATLHCSRWEVVAINQNGYLVSQCEQFKMFLKVDQSLNLHKVTAGKDDALIFEPGYPTIEFPLRVGKRWRKQYQAYSAIEGLRWEGDVKCEVADYGNIEVAAGKFKAFRIECHDNWKVGQAASSINTTHWYAPAAQGIVKTLSYEDPRWNAELKSYSH